MFSPSHPTICHFILLNNNILFSSLSLHRPYCRILVLLVARVVVALPEIPSHLTMLEVHRNSVITLLLFSDRVYTFTHIHTIRYSRVIHFEIPTHLNYVLSRLIFMNALFRKWLQTAPLTPPVGVVTQLIHENINNLPTD